MSQNDKVSLKIAHLKSKNKTKKTNRDQLAGRYFDRPSKKTIVLAALGALFLSLITAVAPPILQAGSTANLNKCASKAIYGRGKKLDHIKIEGHHFHCYPAKVSYPKDKPGVVRIAGRLDHDIRSLWGARPDDELYYGFDIKAGRLIGEVKTKVVKGGFAKTLSAQMRKLLKNSPDWRAQAANLVAGNEIEHGSERLIRSIGSRFTGRGWEKAARKILDKTVEKARARYR